MSSVIHPHSLSRRSPHCPFVECPFPDCRSPGNTPRCNFNAVPLNILFHPVTPQIDVYTAVALVRGIGPELLRQQGKRDNRWKFGESKSKDLSRNKCGTEISIAGAIVTVFAGYVIDHRVDWCSSTLYGFGC